MTYKAVMKLTCVQSGRSWTVKLDDIVIACDNNDNEDQTNVVFRGFPEVISNGALRPHWRATIDMPIEKFYEEMTKAAQVSPRVTSDPFVFFQCAQSDRAWIIHIDDIQIAQPSKDGENTTFIAFLGIPDKSPSAKRPRTFATLDVPIDEYPNFLADFAADFGVESAAVTAVVRAGADA